MVALAAHELNGARIQLKGTTEVWLVFHGSRHYISSPAIYDALFSGISILEMETIDQITRGSDLEDGTCLIRASGERNIYLLTGSPNGEIRKHLIISYHVLKDFGFDENKVVDLPPMALAGIPVGRDIRSAAE